MYWIQAMNPTKTPIVTSWKKNVIYVKSVKLWLLNFYLPPIQSFEKSSMAKENSSFSCWFHEVEEHKMKALSSIEQFRLRNMHRWIWKQGHIAPFRVDVKNHRKLRKRCCQWWLQGLKPPCPKWPRLWLQFWFCSKNRNWCSKPFWPETATWLVEKCEATK